VSTPLPQRYEAYDPPEPEVSERSRGLALALSLVGGFLGMHRFYVGKTGSGIAMIVTLGGLGMWWFYDTILIAFGEFRDADGLPLRRWNVEHAGESGAATHQVQALGDEMRHLQHQVSELAERVDFAERMLAQHRDRDRLSSGS
jgi:TM2 domain-containing membrane protein YozV